MSAPRSTPDEDADVAFAVEGIPWVKGVYAVVEAEKKGATIRYVVQLTSEGVAYGLAEVHYALRRSRGRADSGDVDLVTLLPKIALREIVLGPAERERARARARSTFTPAVLADRGDLATRSALKIARTAPDGLYAGARSVLVVDDDPETLAVVRATFGGGDIVACPYLDTAIALTACWRYARIIVSERFAFGPEGFLRRFSPLDPEGLAAVAVVVTPERLAIALGDTWLGARPWQLLSAPLDPVTLELRFGWAVRDMAGVAVGAALLPVAPRGATEASPEPVVARLPRVLLVDATFEALDAKLGTSAHLDVSVATGLAAALDVLRRPGPPVDTLVCDAGLREGGELVYRALWNALPALVGKTLLLSKKATLDPARSERLLVRPLTAASLVAAVRRFRGVA